MWRNKVLRINLKEKSFKVEELKWKEEYIGGKGLGFKYLYEELKPKIDALSPENKLIFMTGPLTGTIVPLSSRNVVVTKSPATGTILDSYFGGAFGPELKYASYDSIIVEEKSENLVYILIEDEKVEIIDAPKLKGRGCHYVEEYLKKKHGDVKVLSIGIAGENLVKFSCITTEYYRHAGRGGAGAVMGSKNLKAIAVKGSKDLEIRNYGELKELVQRLIREDVLTDDNLWAKDDGTPAIVDYSQESGVLPTRNFSSGVFEGAEKINTDVVKKYKVRDRACPSCPLGCGKHVFVNDTEIDGPEYETLALIGSNCGISDFKAIVEFNRMCDDLGLDTISCGNVVAYAMEATEIGLKDFGVRFGDVESYLRMPELIARREGVGELLSEGVEFLEKKYGGYGMQVKGLEYPGYEPRGSFGMALAYATSDRGACHLRAWPIAEDAFNSGDPFTIEGKAQTVKDMQDENAVKWSLMFCDFYAVSLENMALYLNAVTGLNYSPEDLRKIGERIWNLGRLFNVREGFTRKDDTIPKRISEPLLEGPADGKRIKNEEFEKMLSEYYELRGWSMEGIPKKEKLEELGLG